MTLSYSLRLMCLSLATFVAVLAIATAAVRAFADRALRRAEGMPASSAARFLFIMRMLPATLATASVLFFCVPSYLWFEPDAAGEEAGVIALIAAGIGAALLILGIGRAVWALIATSRTMARWESSGVSRVVGGARILEVAGAGRMIALVGVWRPRLVISKEAAAVLNREQLEAAIEHEMAHETSRDNLKRLMILIAPGFLLGKVERAWKQFAEWVADDRAGSPVDLAEALVRVARVSAGARPPALSTSLLRETEDLGARVDRLLAGRETVAVRHIARWKIVMATVALMGIAPMTLAWVHGVLERLMD
jgi:hypothetical protein